MAQEKSMEGCMEALGECIVSQNYEEGMSYVKVLQSADTLSYAALLDVCYCYMGLGKYKECLDFLDNWNYVHPQDNYISLLAVRGDCNYELKEYVIAYGWFEDYFDQMTEQSIAIPNYYKGLYARSLYKAHEYERATSAFEAYLDQVCAEEGITRETIYNSQKSGYLGSVLYDYAYNLFFQGKEDEGYAQLILAKLCGKEWAGEDMLQLAKSVTFRKNIKHKKSTINKFENILKEIDVYTEMPDERTDYLFSDPSKFWDKLVNENKNMQKLVKELQKEKASSTFREALSKSLTEDTEKAMLYSEFEPLERYDYEKTVEKRLFGKEGVSKDLRTYASDNVNAFATPHGYIWLSSALVLRYHLNIDLLTAVCAHEATHFVCQHSIMAEWEQNKKRKRNEMWAGIAVGINTAAHSAIVLHGASNGVKYDDSYWNGVDKTNANLISSFRKDTHNFQFKYSRHQELEADIMAYRFCESIGIGGYAYIMALQLLDDGDYYLQGYADDDHPTTPFRVELLRYLYDKEHKRPGE